MQLLSVSSFLAGILTVLTPCVLPLLPIILGKSISSSGKWRPFVIIASLMASVAVFTIALKVLSTFAQVPPTVWSTFSGVIVIALGLVTLFPKLWQKFMMFTGIEERSQKLLEAGNTKSSLVGDILSGVALGPVFASCSPTYAVIVATIFPATFVLGLWYLFLYVLGLGTILLAIAIGGRSLSNRLGWTANPNGWFRRTVAIIFILVGIGILTGYDKKIQILVPNYVGAIESKLVSRGTPEFSAPQMTAPKMTKETGSKETTMNATIPKPELNVDIPYAAPELPAGLEWINSDPLTMAKLRGKVVIIDFWTYSCINCLRTLPYLTAWDEKYRDQGLVIIGVHAPEFAFERNRANVEKATRDSDIAYPVVQDNGFDIWKSYDNQYWPAKYFIDKEGKVRSTHFGEGAYEESEQIIQYLLSEGNMESKQIKTGMVDVQSVGRSGRGQNPETYLGTARAEHYVGTPGYNNNGDKDFTLAKELDQYEWSLGGNWRTEAERAIAQKESVLQMSVSGREVYLVLGGTPGATAKVTLDGKPATGADVKSGILTIDGQRLYRLVNEPTAFQNRTLRIEFEPGIEAYAFTFGG